MNFFFLLCMFWIWVNGAQPGEQKKLGGERERRLIARAPLCFLTCCSQKCISPIPTYTTSTTHVNTHTHTQLYSKFVPPLFAGPAWPPLYYYYYLPKTHVGATRCQKVQRPKFTIWRRWSQGPWARYPHSFPFGFSPLLRVRCNNLISRASLSLSASLPLPHPPLLYT